MTSTRGHSLVLDALFGLMPTSLPFSLFPTSNPPASPTLLRRPLMRSSLRPQQAPLSARPLVPPSHHLYHPPPSLPSHPHRPPLSLLSLALLLLLFSLCALSSAQVPGGASTSSSVQTVWGGMCSGNSLGSANGPINAAQLHLMGQHAFDPNSNSLYITDTSTQTVRRWGMASRYTSTLTTLMGVSGSTNPTCGDANATSPGHFTSLQAVVCDPPGNLYALDSACNVIRAVNVSKSSGVYSAYSRVYLNYTFLPTNKSRSMALDSLRGWLYFADGTAIRRVPLTPSPFTTPTLTSSNVTLVNTGGVTLTWATNLTLAANGSLLYLIDFINPTTPPVLRVLNISSGVVSTLSFTAVGWNTSNCTGACSTTGHGCCTAGSSAIVWPVAVALSPDSLFLIISDLSIVTGTLLGTFTVKLAALSPNLSSALPVTVWSPNACEVNQLLYALYQNGNKDIACWGDISGITVTSGMQANQVLFSEYNTGRIKAIDYVSGAMYTVVGGGAPNTGQGNNSPYGWAHGVGLDSSFQPTLTALLFDSTGDYGWVGDSKGSLMRTLDTQSLRTDYLWGDSLLGSNYGAVRGVDGVGTAAQLAPVTAAAKDSSNRLYWTDAWGSVRTLNSTSGGTVPFCLCPSSATCVTTLPQPCATFATSATSGLTLYSNSLYIGFSDSSYSLSTQLLRISMTSTPTVNAYCGGASANVTNNGATCAAIAFKAPQSLIVGSLSTSPTLYVLEPANFGVRYVPIAGSVGSQAVGWLLGCANPGSGCTATQGTLTSSSQLYSPTAMAMDTSQGYLYVADAFTVRSCLLSTSTTCSALTTLAGTSSSGFSEGIVGVSAAVFSTINSLYFDPKHSVLWVADGGNNRIRRFSTVYSSSAPYPTPLIASINPTTGPWLSDVNVTISGAQFTSSATAFWGSQGDSVTGYSGCTSTAYLSSSAVVCTIQVNMTGVQSMNNSQPLWLAVGNGPVYSVPSMQTYTPSWCYTDMYGTPICLNGGACNATRQLCACINGYSGARCQLPPMLGSPPQSSSSSTSPPSSSPFSSSAFSSSRLSSSVASSSPQSSSAASSSGVSSSAVSSSVASSSVVSSSAFSSSRFSSSVASSSLVSFSAVSSSAVSSSVVSSSALSSSALSSSVWSSSVFSSSPASSSVSSSVWSSSPASSSVSSSVSSSLTSSVLSSSLSSSPASSSVSSSDVSSSAVSSSAVSSSAVSSSMLSSSQPSSSALSSSPTPSSSLSSSPFPSSSPLLSSSSFPSSSFSSSASSSPLFSSSSSSVPAPTVAPLPFTVSTITPDSIVSNASMQVNITGVWLWRILHVFIDNQSIPFNVYGAGDDGFPSPTSMTQLSHPFTVQSTKPSHAFHTLSAVTPDDSAHGSVVDGLQLFGDDNSVLTFAVPTLNHTGYLPLVLTFFPQANRSLGGLTNWTGSDWLYYTEVFCSSGWIVASQCLTCPSGGYCPGGGRVWPLPGYWSYNETSAPVACQLPLTCPGALSEPSINADGSRDTSVCASGYTGQYCKACAVNYYADMQACLSCGLQSADMVELAFLLIAASSLFITLAVAVAFASPTRLSSAVSLVILLQHFAVVGKLGGQQLPAWLSWLSEVFNVLALLNFDIQFIKPGCVVAALSFLTVYWVTIGLIGLVSLLFIAASAVRACLSRRSEEASRTRYLQDELRSAPQRGSREEAIRAEMAKPIPWQWRFKARIVHSHLILGSMMYLRLTTMSFQAINCTDLVNDDGSRDSVLVIDLTTQCYEGYHFWSALFIWPLLVLYSVGFPLFCFRLLYRSFHIAAAKRLQRLEPASPEGDSASPSDALAQSPRSTRSRSARRKGAAAPAKKFVFSADAAVDVARNPATPRSPRDPHSGEVELEEVISPSSRVAVNVRVTSSGCQTPLAADGTPMMTPRSLMQVGGKWTGTSPLLHHHSTGWAESVVSPNSIAASIPEGVDASCVVGPDGLDAEKGTARVRVKEERAERRRQLRVVKQAMRELGKDLRRQEMLGYMYRNLKGELYYFRLLLFVTSLAFSAVAVLPTDPTLRLFLTGLCFCLDTLVICTLLPFEVWWKNLTSALTSFLGVIQILITLALINLGLRDSSGSSVDLGHSSQAQQASAAPASDLTGFYSEAGWFEMWLGIGVAIDCVIIVYVHRLNVRKSLWSLLGWGEEGVKRTAQRLRGHRHNRQIQDAPVVELEANMARRDSALPPPAPKRKRKKRKEKPAPPPPTEGDAAVEAPKGGAEQSAPAQQLPELEVERPPPNSPEEDDGDEWEWETDEEALAREMREAAEERERARLATEAEAAARATADTADAQQPPPLPRTPSPPPPLRHVIFAGRKNLNPADSPPTKRNPLWEPKTPRGAALGITRSPLSFGEAPPQQPKTSRIIEAIPAVIPRGGGGAVGSPARTPRGTGSPVTVSPARTPRGLVSGGRTPRGSGGSPYALASAPLRTPRAGGISSGSISPAGKRRPGMRNTVQRAVDGDQLKEGHSEEGGAQRGEGAGGDEVISPSPRPHLRVQVNSDQLGSPDLLSDDSVPTLSSPTSPSSPSAHPTDSISSSLRLSAFIASTVADAAPVSSASASPRVNLLNAKRSTMPVGARVASPRAALTSSMARAAAGSGEGFEHAGSSPSTPRARPAGVPKLTFTNVSKGAT